MLAAPRIFRGSSTPACSCAIPSPATTSIGSRCKAASRRRCAGRVRPSLRGEPDSAPRAHAARQRERSRAQYRFVERADWPRVARIPRERCARRARARGRRPGRRSCPPRDRTRRGTRSGASRSPRAWPRSALHSMLSMRCTSPTGTTAPRRRCVWRKARRSAAASGSATASAGASRVGAASVRAAGASYESFLAVAFPHDEMRIFDYNRVVRDLNGLTIDALLARLRESFTIEPSAAHRGAGATPDVRAVRRRRLVSPRDSRRARAAPRPGREPRREPAARARARPDLRARRSRTRQADRLRRRRSGLKRARAPSRERPRRGRVRDAPDADGAAHGGCRREPADAAEVDLVRAEARGPDCCRTCSTSARPAWRAPVAVSLQKFRRIRTYVLRPWSG